MIIGGSKIKYNKICSPKDKKGLKGNTVFLGSEKDEPEVTEKHGDSDEYVSVFLVN